MRVNKSFLLYALLLVVVGFLFIGCGKKSVEAPETDPGAMGPAESLESEVSATDNIMEGRTSGPMLPVYFDFDSATIRADQVDRIETNAKFLKENAGISIRIEGNCDPRGTKEYNLALGESRALAAKSYLVSLGVSAKRLSVISYGEEKPLSKGTGESAWAQNRRAEFKAIN